MTDGENTTRGPTHQVLSSDFTVVLPIRGTDRELRYMDKSVPSAFALNPGELILACDEGHDGAVREKISKLAQSHGFSNYRVMSFRRDPSWKFQLANVVWESYNRARFDKILSFDVDSSVRKEVLSGQDVVGDGVMVCSFTKKLLIKNPADAWRYMFYRLRVRRSEYVFSGIYWIYRPYYFDVVPKDGFMKIRNGVDAYMLDSIHNTNRYKLVTKKEIGCNSLDYQNEDYPWRQFQTGIWLYANETQSNHRLEARLKQTPNKSPIRRILDRLRLRLGTGLCTSLYIAATYAYPHVLSGYYWASRHPNHDAVKTASGLTAYQWGYLGAEVIKSIKKWRRSDSTGF